MCREVEEKFPFDRDRSVEGSEERIEVSIFMEKG